VPNIIEWRIRKARMNSRWVFIEIRTDHSTGRPCSK
jgi:hypothetical protein